MKKSIRNADAIACKLRLASTKATNHKSEVAWQEWRKWEEIVKRRKVEAMFAKRQRARREISLSGEEKRNYKRNTRDEMNSNQGENDKYLLQLQKAIHWTLRATEVIY